MKPPKGKTFARLDYFNRRTPVLGSGWVFDGGDVYAATQESADRIAREIYGYENFDKMYTSLGEECGDDQNFAYYTEWPEEEWYEDFDTEDELDLALLNLAQLLEFCNGLDEHYKFPEMQEATEQLGRHGR